MEGTSTMAELEALSLPTEGDRHDASHPLADLAAAPGRRRRGAGITSVCSAHPLVIEAALRQAKQGDGARC